MKKITTHFPLIQGTKDGDSYSFKILLSLYEPLFLSLLMKTKRDFPSISLDKDDVLQEIYASFFNLTIDYDFNSNKSFPSYIKTFLSWNLMTKLRKFITNGHKSSNYASILFEENYNTDQDENFEEPDNIEKYKELKKYLTIKEFTLFILIIQGSKPTDISNKLNISKNTYYNLKSKLIYKVQDLNSKIEFF